MLNRFKSLLLGVILMTQTASADHMIASRIYYEWLAGTQYKIYIEKYFECPVNPSWAIPLCALDITNNILLPQTLNLYLDTVYNLPTTCDTIINSCQVTSSIYRGHRIAVYSTTVDFMGPNQWVFGSEECCFIYLDNMANATFTEYVFYAGINLNNVSYNNSARTPAQHQYLVQINQPQVLDFAAVDPDGDSLSYELIPIYEQVCWQAQIASYSNGYTFSQPVSSSVPCYLNPVTGKFYFTPNNLEQVIVAYKVSEYRNGVLCGISHRTVQITVSPNQNSYPALSGINGTFAKSVNVCAGDSVNFSLFTSDADLDSTFISVWDFNGAGANLSVNPGNNQSAAFSWVTDSADARIYSYTLNVTTRDNNCTFYGSSTRSYLVNVEFCPNNLVWPGDADVSLQVDASDLLPIGIAYGQNGPIRTGATLNWFGQPCQGWSQYIPAGANYKHSDCNGDGVVNDNDTLAIVQNMGLSHLRIPPQLNVNNNVASTLTISFSKDTIVPGETVTGTVHLGNNFDLFTGYGIAFNINTSSSDAAFSTANYLTGSFLGNNQLTINDVKPGSISSASTGRTQSNVTGYGPIFEFQMTADPGISAVTTVPVSFAYSKYSNANGFIDVITSINSQIIVDPFVSISELTYTEFNASFNNNILFITQSKSDQPIDYFIIDTTGKTVKEWTSQQQQQQVSMKRFPSGLYMLVTSISGKSGQYKFLKAN